MPLDKALELLVRAIYAGATCNSKWVIRTVLQGAADGLLACWIQGIGVAKASSKKGQIQVETYMPATYTYHKA